MQVSESEEEGADEVDDDVDEERDNEPPQTESRKKTPEAIVPPKESERQLSKKELKKKELEELDAVLAELGLSTKSEASGQDDSNGKIFISCNIVRGAFLVLISTSEFNSTSSLLFP